MPPLHALHTYRQLCGMISGRSSYASYSASICVHLRIILYMM